MRRIIVLVLVAILSVQSYGQARKPSIMVMPEGEWAMRQGYVMQVGDRYYPDYRAALQGEYYLNTFISSIGEVFVDQGFPLRNLAAVLEAVDTDKALNIAATGRNTGADLAETPEEAILRCASADIVYKISYKINEMGPRHSLEFRLQAWDPYTGVEISGNNGTVDPVSKSNNLTPLFIKAVLNMKDNLIDGLQKYFNSIAANGRPIKISLERFDGCPVDFETEIEYKEYEIEVAELIEVWMQDNAVKGRDGAAMYQLEASSQNMMRFNSVHIPLQGTNINGTPIAMDAQTFVRPLARMLKKYLGVDVGVTPVGVSSVRITIGDK